MKFRTNVIVKLKENVKDSKGEAISDVLKRVGLEENPNVRLGKFFNLEIEGATMEEGRKKLENICSKVLSNPVTEVYDILEFEEI